MTYDFISDLAGAGVVLAFFVGGAIAVRAIADEHRKECERVRLVERAAKLTALRRIGMDTHRPLDVYI